MSGVYSTLTRSELPSSAAHVYIAGDYAAALEAVKSWCDRNLDCWSVMRADYVYTGGHEAGVRVTRIRYPRFEEDMRTREELQSRAEAMGIHLMSALHQSSCTVVGPDKSVYLSRKPGR